MGDVRRVILFLAHSLLGGGRRRAVALLGAVHGVANAGHFFFWVSQYCEKLGVDVQEVTCREGTIVARKK
jgi:hypothetical protein